MPRNQHRRLRRVAAACAVVVAMAGCAAPTGGSGAKSSATKTSTVVPATVPDIAATLPGEIRQSGKLVVAVNIPYPPGEFKDEEGELVGFDIDLMAAIATTLGLTPEYRESDFVKIIPSVADETVDVGMSSITVTAERAKLVDLVTYFTAGSQWAQRPNSDIDPQSACGRRIAVKAETVQETQELPARNKACREAGKREIQVVSFIDQDAVNNAVVVGTVDAMSADSPVTAYAIKQSDGKLEAAGAIFDTAPYGIAVRKNSLLAQSLLQALKHLIQSGAYKQIATEWGLAAGMVDKPEISGAAG